MENTTTKMPAKALTKGRAELAEENERTSERKLVRKPSTDETEEERTTAIKEGNIRTSNARGFATMAQWLIIYDFSFGVSVFCQTSVL